MGKYPEETGDDGVLVKLYRARLMRNFPIPTHVMFDMMKIAFAYDKIEICGLLLGRQGMVEFQVPMGNHADLPEIEYAFDPLAQIEAFETAAKNGYDILGIYHSHVKREAYPSPADVHYASYPNMRYVILNQESIRAFTIVLGDVMEEKIILDY